MSIYYRDNLSFALKAGRIFILPANCFLRMGGFPLNIPFDLYGTSLQAEFNHLADGSQHSAWEPVVYKQLLLLPGEILSDPVSFDYLALYKKIFSLIPSDTREVFIYPVTDIWGGSQVEEIRQISSRRHQSYDLQVVFRKRHGFRFPNEFFNPLKRKINEMKNSGSSGEEIRRMVFGEAVSAGIDEALLWYCLDLEPLK